MRGCEDKHGKLSWTPAGVYQGVFDNFVVSANKHVGKHGEVAWHTTSYSSSGDFGHRAYWVVNSQFREVLRQTFADDADFAIEIGQNTIPPNETERVAILKAIAEWSTGDPDSLK